MTDSKVRYQTSYRIGFPNYSSKEYNVSLEDTIKDGETTQQAYERVKVTVLSWAKDEEKRLQQEYNALANGDSSVDEEKVRVVKDTPSPTSVSSVSSRFGKRRTKDTTETDGRLRSGHTGKSTGINFKSRTKVVTEEPVVKQEKSRRRSLKEKYGVDTDAKSSNLQGLKRGQTN